MNKQDLKSLVSILNNLDSKESKRLLRKIEKELKPIKISSRKAKGRNLQKYVAELISKYTSIDAGKDCLISSREMGQSGTDVRLIGEAKEAFPFAVECKSVESVSLYTWIEQAMNNKGDFKYWLLVHKKKDNKPIVILDAEDFFDIYFKK